MSQARARKLPSSPGARDNPAFRVLIYRSDLRSCCASVVLLASREPPVYHVEIVIAMRAFFRRSGRRSTSTARVRFIATLSIARSRGNQAVNQYRHGHDEPGERPGDANIQQDPAIGRRRFELDEGAHRPQGTQERQRDEIGQRDGDLVVARRKIMSEFVR